MGERVNIPKTNIPGNNGLNGNNNIFFQPKLAINQPNNPDSYRDEQEADAMADHVMRMPGPSLNNNSFFKPALSSLQRKCAHCEEDEKKMQRKENNTEITSFFNAVIQPKLTVNQPNDPDSYRDEKEADMMADKVMRMPDPAADNNFFFKPAITSIQRKCAHCEEDEKKIRRKEINSDATTAAVSFKNSCKTKEEQRTKITHSGHSFIQRQNGGDTEQRPPGSAEVSPRFIVVPPPIMQPLQLTLPPLLGGERRPRASFLSTDPNLSLHSFGSFPAFVPLPSLFPGQLPLLQPGILSSPIAQPPSSTTPAQPRGVPVNTSVGTDIGYQPGEGHAVADISITLTANLTAAQFRLGRNSNWSLNFLDQPNAGVTFSFNPQAGAPGEAVSLSHQLGINALSLVLNRDDDRLIEIAATAGMQLDSSGTTSATVGGQLTYHPTDRVGIFVNGGASITREGNNLTPHWGSFTLGVTFDIDQDK